MREMAGEVRIARQSFLTELDGVRIAVQKGESVRVGHPLLTGRAELFAAPEDRADYELADASEQKTDENEQDPQASDDDQAQEEAETPPAEDAS